ncbi:hypothetical protein [Bacillus sp. CDB3]|uniref:hypothetical protein n=1 Tax=Bacillus sp. CDB3 TaxID=360310 RepID=UPI0021187836|nr:hypothetical protein [Bacillus sp. CDB3]
MEIVIQDLQYICELIYEVHQIPVYYVNQFGEIEYEFSSRDLRGAFILQPVQRANQCLYLRRES